MDKDVADFAKFFHANNPMSSFGFVNCLKTLTLLIISRKVSGRSRALSKAVMVFIASILRS